MISDLPIADLTGTSVDLTVQNYAHLKQKLAVVCHASQTCRFAYLVGRRTDGAIFFYADSEPPGHPDESPAGQIYREAPSRISSVFITAKETTVGPYRDRWGTWVTGVVPIQIPGRPGVFAVMGIDNTAKRWRLAVATSASLPLAATLFFVAFLVVLRQRNRLFRHRHESIAAANQELRQAHQRLDNIIEATGVGTWEWNVQTNEVVFNERWAQIVGYRLEELVPISLQTWINLCHPDDLKESDKLLKRHFDGELDLYEIEVRMRHKNGTWVWVHDRGRLVERDREGRPLRMAGTHTDVTLRKQAEEALRDSEEKFAAAFAISPDPLVFSDMNTGRLIDVNPMFERWTGYTRQELIGRTASELGLWEYPQQRADFVSAVRRDGRVNDREVIIRTKGGDLRITWVSGAAVKAAGVECLFIRAHDITDVRRVETERRRLDQRARRQQEAIVQLSIDSRYMALPPLKGIQASLECATELLGVNRASVWMLNEMADELACLDLFVAGAGHQTGTGVLQAASYPRYFAAILAQRAFDAQDALTDPRTSEFAEHYLRPLGIVSMLDAAVRRKGRTAGVVCFEVTGTPRRWTLDEVNFAGQLADHIDRIFTLDEARRAQEALLENEQKISAIGDNLPGSMIFEVAFDASGQPHFLMISEGVKELHECTPAEAMADPMLIYNSIVEEDRMMLLAEERNAIENGNVFRAEVRLRRKDGSIRWSQITSQPRRLHDGTKVWDGIEIDVTERKRAEDEAIVRDRRLRLFLEQSLMAIMIIDSDGRVIEWNRTFENISGLTKDQVLNRPAWEVIIETAPLERRTPAFSNEHREKIIEALRSGLDGVPATTPQEPTTWLCMRPDGTYYHFEHVYFPIKIGDSHQWAVVGYDVTARHRALEEKEQLQAQLQQAMKMEAVGRLAGGVAHDFNNLLTGITGNVSLALMDLDPADPLSDTLNEIGRAAESAASLTRQLLAFSRKQIIEPKVLNLNEVIDRLRKMLVRLIGEDIALETIQAKNLGQVKVDPGQFEQVLINLVVNSRDAMPHGGRLVIETANATLREEDRSRHPSLSPGPYVMLAVTDNGHGMTEEVKSHLFEPFYTTKPKGRGTGLGLATIFGAVQQAGGSIDVETAVGVGTSFRVFLPRVEEQPEPVASQAHFSDLPSGHETVLLVEDEDTVRALAVRVLKRLGYQVWEAANAGEALLMTENPAASIDLLLTDVVMPGMSGRELAERLTMRFAGLRVLFTSGYTEDVVLQHGVAEETLNFISKPYTLSALAKKVRTVLDAKPI